MIFTSMDRYTTTMTRQETFSRFHIITNRTRRGIKQNGHDTFLNIYIYTLKKYIHKREGRINTKETYFSTPGSSFTEHLHHL